ncbi:MAG: LytR/AlgR family response regulator transcription factor [Lacibacter sp.]
MHIVLIEDEQLVSDELCELLTQIDPSITIDAVLSSVKEAIAYFNEPHKTQLIFSDIQLGDGYSFEIFKAVQPTVPIIYCTAYHDHALQAFDHNGIAYVLKPYSGTSIENALSKYRMLQNNSNPPSVNYEALLANITGQQTKPQVLLINNGNKIIPVKTTEVACFKVEHKFTSLTTILNQRYQVNSSLDELEDLCGSSFFRANRQFLVNKESIKEVEHYSLRKLFIKLHVKTEEEIIINKTKASAFLNWLKS